MATSIPAGTPPPPQQRVQVADAQGNFHPVPDEPQYPATAPDGQTFPDLTVGDFVQFTGRVLEIHRPQGGMMSVMVGIPNGSTWMQGQYLTRIDPSAPDPTAELKVLVAEKDEMIETLNEKLEQSIADAEAYKRTAVKPGPSATK